MPHDASRASAGLREHHVEARDGTRLYVRTYTPEEPKGAPIVFVDGLGCEGYAWTYLIDYFRKERPLVYWQYRGHGRSEVPADLSTLTVDTMVDDLERVLEETRTERPVLCGHSMGVQVALESYRRLRAGLSGLVLVCGGYERPVDTFHAAPLRSAAPTVVNRVMRRVFPYLSGAFIHFPEHAMRVWRRVIPTRLSYELAVRVEVNGRRIDRRDFWPYFQHLGEMDMRVFALLARALAEHSAGDLLADVSLPTLIIGGGRDTFTPVWLSEEMWRRIPESEYLFIPDGTHATPIEHPQLIGLRLEKFLRERVDVQPVASTEPSTAATSVTSSAPRRRRSTGAKSA